MVILFFSYLSYICKFTQYLALAALAALTKYVEFQQQLIFTSRSLQVTFRGLDGLLIMDPQAIANLELVRNLATGSSKDSLLALLDRTKTPMGSRYCQHCNII